MLSNPKSKKYLRILKGPDDAERPQRNWLVPLFQQLEASSMII
jgi:hypothetical protein